MFPTKRGRATGLILASAIVLGIAGGAAWGTTRGVGAAPETPSANRPTSFAAATTPVEQAATSDQAIADTLAGLDRSLFESVSVGTSPTPYDRQGSWFYVDIAPGDDASVSTQVGLWEADLAQGAVADRMAAGEPNLANVLVGSSLQQTSGDGKLLPVRGGAGDIEAGQSFAASGEQDSEIVKNVTEVATKYGLENIHVRILHALDPAVLVTAEVKNPEVLGGKFDALRSDILGNPIRYEGLYLRIDTPTLHPLVIGSTAYRSGAGRLSIASGYDDLVGAAHGGGGNQG